MLFKIIISTMFLFPIFGSMSVLIKAIFLELRKSKTPELSVNKLKVVGILLLTFIGLYIGLFIIWFIWLPSIQLPLFIKIFSTFLAAPYLFGVIGMGFALKKATEFGASPAKMASHISESIDKQ
jgi:hypothetical protein